VIVPGEEVDAMRIGAVVAIALLLLTIAVPVSAAKPEIYPLGGLAVSSLGGDAEEFGDLLALVLEDELPGSQWRSTKKSRTGFDIGLGVRYGASEVVGSVVEVRYATRGVKYDLTELTGTGVGATTTLKLNYIEMPVLLEFTPEVTGSVQPVFVAGPVLALKASSKFTVEAEGGGTSVSSTTDLSDGVKSTAFAGLIGAGVKIKAGAKSSFLLQGRFQAGFSNLIDDPVFSVKSQDFSILAGWSFGR
jgi:hypothetical protein